MNFVPATFPDCKKITKKKLLLIFIFRILMETPKYMTKLTKIEKIELFLQRENLAPVSHKIFSDADMRD